MKQTLTFPILVAMALFVIGFVVILLTDGDSDNAASQSPAEAAPHTVQSILNNIPRDEATPAPYAVP